MSKFVLDCSCDSISDLAVTAADQRNIDIHLDDACGHLMGAIITNNDGDLVPGTCFQSTLEIILINSCSKHLVTGG